MSDVTALPARLQAGASLDDIVRTIQALQDYAQLRDPDADGGKVDKFVTINTAVQAGLLAYAAGGFASGASGGYVVPGILTSNPADATPPTPISGLAVASSTSHYLITVDAPTYLQGGGNGRTIIYGANYSGAGPLPTFANASERGTIPGRGVFLVLAAEPGVQTHFWAKAETRHPTLQASPTGGTNGITSTADLIENQHVLSLSAAKLTAGSIDVSEYIQSTGFVSGSAGWRIKGDGTAEFSGVIVRGTLYATAGTIGGITISSGSLSYGQTAYDTGTGYWLGVVAGVPKFSIGSSTKALLFDGTTTTLRGEVVATGNIVNDATSYREAATATEWGLVTISLTIASGDIPSGETTVPVIIIGSQDVIGSMFFDISIDPADYVTAGNLLAAQPPDGGVFAMAFVEYLAVGTYEIACYNHGTGDAYELASRLRTIVALVQKK